MTPAARRRHRSGAAALSGRCHAGAAPGAGRGDPSRAAGELSNVVDERRENARGNLLVDLVVVLHPDAFAVFERRAGEDVGDQLVAV
jgi:hypothetical protein